MNRKPCPHTHINHGCGEYTWHCVTNTWCKKTWLSLKYYLKPKELEAWFEKNKGKSLEELQEVVL